MKKWISLLCVCVMVFGMITASVISASAEGDDNAVEKASTAVDVKSGDSVTYILKLDKVAQPIIGSDFSVYYDSSVFKLESVADYNNETNPDEWIAVINPDLDGEVRGVWSILKGVDFSSQRNFITLNLKATADADNTHISYRIRFLYDNDVFNSNDHPQITTYEFTCDVLVNGDKVLDTVPPELNDVEEEENGKFVPSYDGKSEHADASIPGVVDKAKNNTGNGKSVNVENNAVAENGANGGSANGGSANGGSANGGSGGNNAAGGSAGSVEGGSNQSGSAQNAQAAPPATTAEGYYIIATDADGNVTATSDQAPQVTGANNAGNKGGGSPVLWIIIVVVVIAGGGAAIYFFMKKQSSTKPGAPAEEGIAPADAEADAPAEEGITPADAVADAPANEESGAAVDEAQSEVLDEQTTQAADDPADSNDQ